MIGVHGCLDILSTAPLSVCQETCMNYNIELDLLTWTMDFRSPCCSESGKHILCNSVYRDQINPCIVMMNNRRSRKWRNWSHLTLQHPSPHYCTWSVSPLWQVFLPLAWAKHSACQATAVIIASLWPTWLFTAAGVPDEVWQFSQGYESLIWDRSRREALESSLLYQPYLVASSGWGLVG